MKKVAAMASSAATNIGNLFQSEKAHNKQDDLDSEITDHSSVTIHNHDPPSSHEPIDKLIDERTNVKLQESVGPYENCYENTTNKRRVSSRELQELIDDNDRWINKHSVITNAKRKRLSEITAVSQPMADEQKSRNCVKTVPILSPSMDSVTEKQLVDIASTSSTPTSIGRESNDISPVLNHQTEIIKKSYSRREKRRLLKVKIENKRKKRAGKSIAELSVSELHCSINEVNNVKLSEITPKVADSIEKYTEASAIELDSDELTVNNKPKLVAVDLNSSGKIPVTTEKLDKFSPDDSVQEFKLDELLSNDNPSEIKLTINCSSSNKSSTSETNLVTRPQVEKSSLNLEGKKLENDWPKKAITSVMNPAKSAPVKEKDNYFSEIIVEDNNELKDILKWEDISELKKRKMFFVSFENYVPTNSDRSMKIMRFMSDTDARKILNASSSSIKPQLDEKKDSVEQMEVEDCNDNDIKCRGISGTRLLPEPNTAKDNSNDIASTQITTVVEIHERVPANLLHAADGHDDTGLADSISNEQDIEIDSESDRASLVPMSEIRRDLKRNSSQDLTDKSIDPSLHAPVLRPHKSITVSAGSTVANDNSADLKMLSAFQDKPYSLRLAPKTVEKFQVSNRPDSKTSTPTKSSSSTKSAKDPNEPDVRLSFYKCEGKASNTSKNDEVNDLPRITSDETFKKTPTKKVKSSVELCAITPPDLNQLVQSSNKKGLGLGCIVWAKWSALHWWPGVIVLGTMCGLPVSQWGKYWIFWFGDHKVSEMNREKIVLFGENFMKCYSKNAGKTLRRAVVEAIQECAARTRHYLRDDNEALLWALESFTGVTDINFSPQCGEELSVSIMKRLLDIKQIIRKKENNLDVDNKLFRIETACETTKANLFQEVRDRQRKIEDICIACDNTDVTVAAQHPFFYGGICGQCKSDIMETMFATGSDGLLMYCVVCGNGGELFVCDDPLCNRVYCSGCILSLAGKDVLEVVHTATPWLCFMCAEYNSFTQGLLKPKANWKNNIIDLFQPDGYQPISPDDFPRQPVRVLSLFDGIGTGKFVLNELGIKVEVYYASEIDQDAINVTKTQHGDAVIHIADVRQLDDEKLKQIGPIDLLIGGSPCNDLSLVNPARKGLGEGSGLLFFEYFRILTTIQSLQHRHLFWLFENVVSMPKDIKSTITRFLRCEPVLLDAIYFSAQKRARYFWGNIPGMYCPPQLEENPDPNLDEMLTPNCNRRATVSKIRTVTGRSNSIKQGKTVNGIMPVVMDGKEDGLWIPELERIFGFPAHYTDVGNLPPHKRQVLLGKSWSVPVIRKLLFPLKKFYETL